MAKRSPLNELGSNPEVLYGPFFLRPRGTAGRTPSLWNLDTRITYEPPTRLGRLSPRFSLDMFHVLNPRKAVLLDEQHFFATDDAGNQTAPNSNYLQPLLYQPSFSVRLGMTIGL